MRVRGWAVTGLRGLYNSAWSMPWSPSTLRVVTRKQFWHRQCLRSAIALPRAIPPTHSCFRQLQLYLMIAVLLWSAKSIVWPVVPQIMAYMFADAPTRARPFEVLHAGIKGVLLSLLTLAHRPSLPVVQVSLLVGLCVAPWPLTPLQSQLQGLVFRAVVASLPSLPQSKSLSWVGLALCRRAWAIGCFRVL